MRPSPPEIILSSDGPMFIPSPDLEVWLRKTFIDPGSPLENEDHEHLQMATLGVLWTNVPNNRQMRQVIGQAEIPQPQGNAWVRARQKQQMGEWFGMEPDFILTFSADVAVTLDDASFCALVEHELYHCAQAPDVFGTPKFKRDGTPVFAIRGHDVEEFIGVVRRYGADATGSQTRALIDAARGEPTVASALINGACGTCRASL